MNLLQALMLILILKVAPCDGELCKCKSFFKRTLNNGKTEEILIKRYSSEREMNGDTCKTKWGSCLNFCYQLFINNEEKGADHNLLTKCSDIVPKSGGQKIGEYRCSAVKGEIVDSFTFVKPEIDNCDNSDEHGIHTFKFSCSDGKLIKCKSMYIPITKVP